jgi:phage terminase large subunit-like protein
VSLAELSDAGSFDTLPNPTKELFNNNTSISTATINLDLKTKQVYYYSQGATGNFTVNFRGDGSTSLDTLLATGEMISSTLIVKNGANAYLADVVKVDSTTVNAYWFDPSPAGTPNGLDVYSFTILKTAAATFEVIVNIAPAATL